MPPSFDLLEAMAAVRTLQELQQVVDRGVVDLRQWRMDTQRKLREGMETMDAIADKAGVPKVVAGTVILPEIDKIFPVMDDLLDIYGSPFLGRPDVGAAMEKLAKVQGPAGRFLRKQLKRIEDIRIEQYNAVVDMRYALMAYRSEYDGDNVPVATFTDGNSLGDYLRKQNA